MKNNTKGLLGGIFIIGCMELYRVMKRNTLIEELGYKVDVMRVYLVKLQEEQEETEAVHRTLYMIHHEMKLLKQKEKEKQLEVGERQKIEVLEYVLPKFEPLDYVPYEDEKEEYFIRIREALEVSERKMNEWEKEKKQQEDYYKVDAKIRWTVFACYIGLLAILGYTAYEGYSVLQEYLPRRNV